MNVHALTSCCLLISLWIEHAECFRIRRAKFTGNDPVANNNVANSGEWITSNSKYNEMFLYTRRDPLKFNPGNSRPIVRSGGSRNYAPIIKNKNRKKPESSGLSTTSKILIGVLVVVCIFVAAAVLLKFWLWKKIKRIINESKLPPVPQELEDEKTVENFNVIRAENQEKFKFNLGIDNDKLFAEKKMELPMTISPPPRTTSISPNSFYPPPPPSNLYSFKSTSEASYCDPAEEFPVKISDNSSESNNATYENVEPKLYHTMSRKSIAYRCYT